MLSLPMILLQLQPHLPHPLTPLARLDLMRLLALRGSLSAHLLVHLLSTTQPLLLQPFHYIDGATLRCLFGGGGGISVLVIVMAVLTESAEQEAAARERSRVRELWALGQSL